LDGRAQTKGVNGDKPFWNQGCTTTFAVGNVRANSQDDDLTKTPHPEIDAFSTIPDTWIGAHKTAFASAFYGGISLENDAAKREAGILMYKFENGENSTFSFSASSNMSRLLSSDPAFLVIAQRFEKAAKEFYGSYHTLDGFDGQQLLGRPYIKDTWFMHTVLGGTQQFDATITKVTANEILVRYSVWDHFGAGTNDATSKLPGLPSMYILQRVPGRKYVPFIWGINVNRKQ